MMRRAAGTPLNDLVAGAPLDAVLPAIRAAARWLVKFHAADILVFPIHPRAREWKFWILPTRSQKSRPSVRAAPPFSLICFTICTPRRQRAIFRCGRAGTRAVPRGACLYPPPRNGH